MYIFIVLGGSNALSVRILSLDNTCRAEEEIDRKRGTDERDKKDK